MMLIPAVTVEALIELTSELTGEVLALDLTENWRDREPILQNIVALNWRIYDVMIAGGLESVEPRTPRPTS